MLKVRYAPGWIQISTAVVVALALDAVVLGWAVVTVLAPSCGDDVAWATASGLAALATVVAGGGVVAGLVRWRRRRPLGGDGARAQWPPDGTMVIRPAPRWPTLVLAAVVLLGLAAAVAALELPTGRCG